MTVPQISKAFSFVPIPAVVSNKVADHIRTLQDYGFDKGKILDIYVESQLLPRKGNDIKNPMRYMSSYLGTPKGGPDIRYRELECIYNKIVRDWCKIEPSRFLQEYSSYIHQSVNDTGLENGFVREQFLRFSLKNEKLLVIDPHPVVMESFFKSDRDITFAFSDERYYNAFCTSEVNYPLVNLHTLPSQSYNRVLFFASTLTPGQIKEVLDRVRASLIPQKQTNIYILMQTQFIEKRQSKPELWDFLIQNFSLFKICLIDKNAVNVQPKKRCLVMLQNTSNYSNEILVQKTKLLDNQTFATLEFRKVPFASFVDRDRTLSEMYNTDYIDYSVSSRRERAFPYKFSEEISIWVSCCRRKDGMFRPYYSLYEYPTAEQLRKNTLPRGSAIKTRIPGKWYDSKEEAIASAEALLLNDESLAKSVRKAVEKQFAGKPVSAKTHLFLNWEALKKMKDFDDKLCESVFFKPNNASHPICAWAVGAASEKTIKDIINEHVQQSGYSKTKADVFWTQMQMILDYAVISNRYAHNPIRHLICNRQETDKNKSNMRKALVKRSFSKETERAFISYLISDTENAVLAQMLLTKYFTRLPNNILCALTWGDYLYNPELDLGQLSITKFFPFRSQKTELIMPEERRRFIPVVSLISKMMEERIANGQCKSIQYPLFSLPESKNRPITPRQLQDYCNGVLQKLQLPQFKIMIFDDKKPPESSDINDYGGDILLANFEFHSCYDALLEPDEIAFIAGRKPQTTEAQFYCDYNNMFLQLMMRVKLDRWGATFFSQEVGRELHCVDIDSSSPFQISLSPTGELNELYIEFDVQENVEDKDILLSIVARYGGAISVEYFEEVL